MPYTETILTGNKPYGPKIGGRPVEDRILYAYDHLIHINHSEMATEKNKKPIIPPHEVTISDFTIGFSVVDLVENEVWLVIFFFKCGFFQRLKSEK